MKNQNITVLSICMLLLIFPLGAQSNYPSGLSLSMTARGVQTCRGANYKMAKCKRKSKALARKKMEQLIEQYCRSGSYSQVSLKTKVLKNSKTLKKVKSDLVGKCITK